MCFLFSYSVGREQKNERARAQSAQSFALALAHFFFFSSRPPQLDDSGLSNRKILVFLARNNRVLPCIDRQGLRSSRSRSCYAYVSARVTDNKDMWSTQVSDQLLGVGT